MRDESAPEAHRRLALRLSGALAFAHDKAPHLYAFDSDASQAWEAIYHDLEREVPGLFGEITARGSTIVRRLAVIYAVLDKSPLVTMAHVRAALAIWSYSERSARYLFGGSLGNSNADKILRALFDHAAGMSRGEVSDLFSGNKARVEIQAALDLLLARGLVRTFKDKPNRGRPSEIWQATTYNEEEK